MYRQEQFKGIIIFDSASESKYGNNNVLEM